MSRGGAGGASRDARQPDLACLLACVLACRDAKLNFPGAAPGPPSSKVLALLSGRAKSLTASRYSGLYRSKNGRWQARIMHGGKGANLGIFATQEEGARAYDAAARHMSLVMWVPGPSLEGVACLFCSVLCSSLLCSSVLF